MHMGPKHLVLRTNSQGPTVERLEVEKSCPNKKTKSSYETYTMLSTYMLELDMLYGSLYLVADVIIAACNLFLYVTSRMIFLASPVFLIS